MTEATSPSVTTETAAATTHSQATKPFIFFDLAGTTYAVPSHLVQQIEMVEHITPVPNASVFVDGFVFARGQVVTVVNLRSRFGFDRTPIDLQTRLMVMAIPGRSLGLLVDSAREFTTLRNDSSIELATRSTSVERLSEVAPTSSMEAAISLIADAVASAATVSSSLFFDTP